MPWWETFAQWVSAHKDALSLVCGSGVGLTMLAVLWKVVAWLLRWRRERQLRLDDNPFVVLPPGSDILHVALPDTSDSPLNDRRIPYKARVPGRDIRREMEDLLKEKRALLVCGRSGLGKTREAAHLAQILNREGWTVLYLPPDAWLEPPARLPKGVPNRKLLFFLDDLSRRCYSARQEINPRAESPAQPLTLPFQERLRKTLEAYETFCGKGEILVLATTRDERVPEYEGEPAEWDKLEWARYPELWNRFACYKLPEPDPQVAAELLAEVGQAAGVQVVQPEVLARRNDGTLRNLVENLRTAANPDRGRPVLNPQTFRDTLRGTWEARYRRAVGRHPEARYLYQAALLLQRYGFPLRRYTLLPLARSLMGPGRWWAKYVRLPRALRHLERYEGIYTPRDGQLEVAGALPEIDERLAFTLWRTAFWNFWRGGKSLPFSIFRVGHFPSTFKRQILVAITLSLYFPDEVRALFLFTTGKKDKGRTILLQKIESGKVNALLIALLGEFAPELMDALQKRIQKISITAAEWEVLGDVYRDLGRYDDAIQAYQKASDLDPNLAAPWNGLGLVYMLQGRLEETLEAFQKAIGLDPKFAYPWRNLGLVYTLQGRLEEALEAFRKAVELAPDCGKCHSSLMGILRRLGREEEARRKEEIARRLMVKENAYNRACFAALTGDKDEALRLLQVALEKAPGLRPWARRDPDLESLHDDPRFWEIVNSR